MRCAVLKCKENQNGYCSCSSYVEIDESGSCSEMLILNDTEEIE